MPPPPAALVRYLRRLAAPDDRALDSDSALLARFARDRDEAAFAAFVARQGPMVVSVCRHVLRDAHDAEDCAQAAFAHLYLFASVVDGKLSVYQVRVSPPSAGP